jgi:hypothetical protein
LSYPVGKPTYGSTKIRGNFHVIGYIVKSRTTSRKTPSLSGTIIETRVPEVCHTYFHSLIVF